MASIIVFPSTLRYKVSLVIQKTHTWMCHQAPTLTQPTAMQFSVEISPELILRFSVCTKDDDGHNAISSIHRL